MKFVAAFLLLCVAVLASAPSEKSPPSPMSFVGGNAAPAPMGDGNFSVGKVAGESADPSCSYCDPQPVRRVSYSSSGCSGMAASGCSGMASSGCSGNYGASGCSGNYGGVARFPMARLFGAGMYRASHPFARRRAAFNGCG